MHPSPRAGKADSARLALNLAPVIWARRNVVAMAAPRVHSSHLRWQRTRGALVERWREARSMLPRILSPDAAAVRPSAQRAPRGRQCSGVTEAALPMRPRPAPRPAWRSVAAGAARPVGPRLWPPFARRAGLVQLRHPIGPHPTPLPAWRVFPRG